jgi:hypothetical protein
VALQVGDDPEHISIYTASHARPPLPCEQTVTSGPTSDRPPVSFRLEPCDITNGR